MLGSCKPDSVPPVGGWWHLSMPSNFESRGSVLITTHSEVAAGRITLVPENIGFGAVSLRQLADSSLWLHCLRWPCPAEPRLSPSTLLPAVRTFLPRWVNPIGASPRFLAC